MANDAAHPEPGQANPGQDQDQDQEPVPESSPLPPGPPPDWFVLLDRIEQEVRQLEAHRQAWRNLSSGDAFNVSGKPGTFGKPQSSGSSGVVGAPGPSHGSNDPAWLGRLYFRSQALGVRRMVDGDRRAGSFKRLLHKMTEDCAQLTRDWFVESDAGRANDDDADAQFTRLADPWRSGHLDSEVPREDLRALESSCTGIKRYVDQYVTHAQLDPDAGTPEPADVDAAIDLLLSLLAKYTLLLRPAGPGTDPGRRRQTL